MIDVILVSIGGFFGAICRFFFSNQLQKRNKTGFPIATLLVNLIGAFLLGLLVGMHIKGHLYDLMGIGFMGAFTTFSTFKLESESLRKSKKRRFFFSYLLISYAVGITLAFYGLMLGRQN